jgi:hypothetical protein
VHGPDVVVRFRRELEGRALQESIEIVSSQTEPMTQSAGELIRFSIKVQFQPSPDAAAKALPGAGG